MVRTGSEGYFNLGGRRDRNKDEKRSPGSGFSEAYLHLLIGQMGLHRI